ncbi:MAG: hypothetical protein P4M08_00825 [Oligoflexia bacterium]|nr:hypothetical protein [Oligoflexia bacterium]
MKKKLKYIIPISAAMLSATTVCADSGASNAASPSAPAQAAPQAVSSADQALSEYGITGQDAVQNVHELTASDLQAMNISVTTDKDLATHSNVTASLNGMVFTRCLNDFPVQISQYSGGGATGFRISEPSYNPAQPDQSFESCQENLRNVAHMNCNVISCTPISSLPNSSIDLSHAGNVKVGIFHKDLNSDNPDPVFENIGSNELDHTSATTLRANKISAAQARRQAELDALKWQSSHCVKDQDQLAVAQDACSLLQVMLNISDDDLPQMLPNCDPAKIEKEKLAALIKDVQKVDVKDPDAIAQAKSEIDQFASDNPDMDDNSAYAYSVLANKLVSQPNATAADYASANSIMSSAASLPNISAQQAAGVQDFQNKAQYGALALQGTSGNYSPITFIPAYQSLMQSAQKSYTSSCGSNGGQANASSCASSYQFMQQVQSLPTQVTRELQQKQTQQAQLQQQMMQAQAMLPQSTMGMSGMGGMTGMGASSALPSLTPLANGGGF